MLIDTIVNNVNVLLAGELLDYIDLEPHLDKAIDDINAQMNTRYPTFSELRAANHGAPVTQYTCFPDRYIRTCLITGAAYYYYLADEEGINTAPAYKEEYYKGLFMMLRDYVEYDKHYKAHDDVGSLRMCPDIGYAGGVEINVDIWNI